jgi:hypothetical protein
VQDLMRPYYGEHAAVTLSGAGQFASKSHSRLDGVILCMQPSTSPTTSSTSGCRTATVSAPHAPMLSAWVHGWHMHQLA